MSESLKDQVLQAAKALFMAHGYDQVGMRDIAQAVGKQPVQVYRLNLSKSDILAELIIQLNDEQISQIPKMLKRIKGDTLSERVYSYLLALYALDIQYQPIRSVGAAFGWTWSREHEARVVSQVMQMIKPIVGWMTDAGLDDIRSRTLGMWSLYYVGYRQAVIHGRTAQDCLDEIWPSLRYYLTTPTAG